MPLLSSPFAELAAEMRGRVATSADPDWDAVRHGFNLAIDLHPAAIALPRDAADVEAAVRFARAHGVQVVPQATGHNNGAFGSLDGALVVDVRELREISIDAGTRRVRVGAGVRWQDVVPQLSDLGLAALHGSSPLVGIAGYSLGGGMGWLARKHGLQTNSVTALEIVTADAQLRRVDAENDPELFWALRGGNGNYGVVTAIEFAVLPVAELYAGAMFFPLGRADEVLAAWTRIAPDLPEEMMTWTSLMQFPDLPEVPEPVRGQGFTVFAGAFLGEAAEGEALLAPVRELGPLMDTFMMAAPVALSELAMDPPEPLPCMTTTALVSDLTPETVRHLLAVAGEGSGSPLPALQLRHMGGALARREPGAGARATLPGEYCVFAVGVVPDPQTAELVAAYLAQIDRAVASERVGDYPNFVEEPTDLSAYFDAETWERLRTVKSLHDPDDVFRGNHRIPPADIPHEPAAVDR